MVFDHHYQETVNNIPGVNCDLMNHCYQQGGSHPTPPHPQAQATLGLPSHMLELAFPECHGNGTLGSVCGFFDRCKPLRL